MAATVESGTGSPESLASLERLKQVETDADEQLRRVREKIERTLSHLRDASEALVQAARDEAEKGATATIDRARVEAETEAARIVAGAKAALAQRATEGTSDLTPVWDRLRQALFEEFG
ncbi:MAG: hypothetical protein L3K14_01255 [Thermoplasmata archaeon]|nr:hypothetical protein [Thermoplasmata archaeon]